MYFPGDPLFAYDPIFQSVRDPEARERLVARFDLERRRPSGRSATRWDIVAAADAVRGMRTPSQTVGPYFTLGLCIRPQHELPGGSVRVEGRVFDGEGEPIDDAMLELWHPDAGWGRCGTDGEGRFAFLVPEERAPLRGAGVRARAAQARR